MRKIIFMLSVSLDGYFEGPEHDISWSLVDDELHQHFNDETRAMGAFLHGRRTWQLMAEYWPHAGDDPEATAPMREFAGIWLEKPKYAFSHTLQEAGWNTTLKQRVDPDEIRALKAQPGGDLVVGGPELALTFMELDLIDEYRIYVHPVLIGRGKPAFPPSDFGRELRFAETRTFGNGVVMLRYERGGAGAAE